ncbi:fibrocystin-L-like [Glandiceps talaboti]
MTDVDVTGVGTSSTWCEEPRITQPTNPRLNHIVLFTVEASPQVSSISPTLGSVRGGSRLSISGSGFSENQFNFGPDDAHLGNIVFLKSTTETIECDVIKYYTTPETITCDTRRAKAGKYTVQVAVDGKFIEDQGGSYCSDEDDCKFSYTEDASPTVSSVSPSSGVPGTQLYVEGKIYTSRYYEGQEVSDEDDDDSLSFLRSYLDNQECSLIDEDTDDVYGITLTSNEYGNFYCMPTGTTIGSQNVTFLIDNYGRSWSLPAALHVSAYNKLYLYQTHAEIYDVYPTTGSIEGGTYLTISGDYFDTDAEVYVGGVPCTIDNVTMTEITCWTGAKSTSQALYPGQRGMLWEMWADTTPSSLSDIQSYDSSTANYRSEIVREAHAPDVEIYDSYASRLSGYFLAPVNSDYTFYLMADDKAELYLSTTEHESDKQKIASCSSHTTSWTSFEEQQSAVFTLTGGQSYYIEATHIEYTGGDHVQIGVWMDNTPFVNSQVSSATNEKQQIKTDSFAEIEEQQLTIEWNGLSDDTFSFVYDDFESDPVSVTASASEIEEAIFQMFNVQCQDIGSGRAAFFLDFETPQNGPETGTRVKDEEPYCGQTSLKNPTDIFEADVTMSGSGATYGTLSLSRYGHFCFAYIGGIADGIWMNILFTEKDGSPRTRGRWVSFSAIHNNQWQHHCLDLEDVVMNDNWYMSRYQLGTGFEIDKLVFVGLTEQDFYVDNVFVGSSDANYVRVGRAGPPHGLYVTDVTVEAGENSTYSISMYAENCGHDFPLLGIKDADMVSGDISSDSDEVSFRNSTWDVGSMISVDRLQAASPPLRGTLGVELGGKTASIPAGATSAEVKEIFDNSLDMGVTVERTGTCSGYSWAIEFTQSGGNKPPMTLNSTGLVGLELNVTAVTLRDGGLFLGPIPGDMLRTPHDIPQVDVIVNHIPSSCHVNGSCGFLYSAMSTPNVTSISPSSGSSDSGTQVTLSGSGFSTNTGDNSVVIGGVDCDVVSSSDSQIVCDVGDATGGTQDVVVVVQTDGLAAHTSGQLQFQYEVGVTSVTPDAGSVGGGLTINVIGFGFGDNVTVDVGGSPCEVVSVDYDNITCVTPPGSSGTEDVTVSINDVSDTLSDGFEYDLSLSPSVSSLSLSESGVAGGSEITIGGSGFGSNLFSSESVRIGDEPCNVTSYSDSSIGCVLPAQAPGNHSVKIFVDGQGFADASSVSDVNYKLKVTNVSPTHGSVQGGTLVSITGEGFSDDSSENQVFFGGIECVITSSAEDQIDCITNDMGVTHSVDNSGFHTDYGLGYKWNPQTVTIKAGDTVLWEWATALYVDGIGYAVQQTADAFSDVYDGTGFRSGPKTPQGSFSHTFQAPGTYYYSSGAIDNDGELYMKGVVIVEDPNSVVEKLILTVDGFEAIHDTSSGVSAPVSGDSCPGDDTNILSCAESEPNGDDSDAFYFAFWDCSTALVEEVSPNNGTSDTVLTITGKGFSTTQCENVVTIDGHPCDVQSSSQDTIVCSIDTEDELTVGNRHDVNVNVKNLGNSLNLGGAFTMWPSISSISPTTGSLAGGTILNITGDGFSQSVAQVNIGSGKRCNVISLNYTEIICITPTNIAGSDEVTVTVNSVDAVCMDSNSNCIYTYSESFTPSVNSTSPTSVSGSSTTVTLSGSGFGTDDADISITFGEDDCAVQTIADDEITCDVGYVPVGDHDIVLYRDNHGNAQLGQDTITSDPVIDSISPTSGSINGGTVLTIAGSGFHVDDTSVDIDGDDCDIISVNISEIVCTTTSHSAAGVDLTVTSGGVAYTAETYTFSSGQTPTVSSVSPSSGTSADSITISGTGFSSVTSDVTVTLDGVECTVSSASTTSIDCDLGEHSAGTFDVVVHVSGKGLATSSSTFEYQLTLTAVSPTQCSFGGGRDVTITGDGFDSVNSEVTICGNECVIYNATATEIICEAPANDNLASGTETCDVIVSISTSDATATSSSAFTYQSSMTSVITSVSPTRGGTGGGTIVTITGTGFSDGENTVTIDGTTCTIISENSTDIVCQTGAHYRTIQTKVRVEVGNNGIATQDDADYYYVDVWSSIYTWGGLDPPVEGDFVIVPAGQTLVLDTDTPVLKMLLIEGGSVIFDEKDIELNAENILIMDDGLLQVGTEDEPFQHQGIITMHGHVRSTELPVYGAKTLAVRHGTLDLHGIPVPVTWTYLAETAPADATEMTLMQSVTWQPGDQLVIATTNHRHSQGESEVLTITDVSDDGFTITFTPPLVYEHISVTETLDGEVLETRAEVGLLTHNVKVRGSVHDAWTEVIEACPAEFDTNQFATQTCFQGRFGEEIGSDQFGSQIMIHARAQDQGLVTGRIEYVEVTHAGQAFRLGRYPIHFHLNGDVSGSYVRGCGIHHTFNRAVTIHTVHHLLVEHNVAYNVMGHAYFLEDGIETSNIIQYNLGVFVKGSSSLLNVDVTPATFWVTNPNNTIRHNAAAGGTHFGFWYNMPEHPGGPSFTTAICPRKIPVSEFQNNTAHSFGWYGLWVFPEYFPMVGGTCDSTTPTPSIFDSLTAWNCERGAEVIDSGPVQFHNFLMANNEKAGIEMVAVSGGWDDGPMVKDSVIIGHSSISNSTACTTAGVKTPKTSDLTVDGVKFINFDLDTCATIRTCAHCKTKQGGWPTRFQNLEFVDSPNKVAFEWEHEAILQDIDGSLTGSANTIVTPDNNLLPPNHCDASDAAFDMGGSTGAVCDSNVKLHRFAFNNASPSSLKYKNVLFTNEYGTTSVIYKKKRLTHMEGWMVTLLDGSNHNMIFEDVDHVTNISYTGTFYNFEDGDYVTMYHNLTQSPDVFSIIGQVENSTEEMVTYDDNSNGEYYFDNATKYMTYLVSGKGESDPVSRNVHLEVYRCYYNNCIKPVPPPPPSGRPDDAVMWSEAASWEGVESGWGGNYGNGVYGPPLDGDNVQILPEVWMVADVALPSMHKLYVYGTLEIADTQDNVVNVTYLFIHGGRVVAGWSEAEPFEHDLKFLLRGHHFTPDMPLPNGPNMGSKVIGVFGGLDLHGKNHSVYWTKLAATANVGDDEITLEDAVEWRKGDEIVIAPTDYEPFHTETFTIAQVIDANTLKLNSSLAYAHLGVTHTVNNGAWTYTMAAEVGLLTRNIVIEGEDYDDMFDESFGGRVLVGSFYQSGTEYTGYARIANVEFKLCGQEGWPDFFDPRYSLAFLDTGLVTQSSPSYIRGNSFHNGFNTAIGVFGAFGVVIENNVVHHTVGPGIVVWDGDHRLIHNLVTLTIFPGTYQDRFEPENLVWMGGIEVHKAKDVVMKNNAVAGSERVGFRISGEPCFEEIAPENKWEGNVAHTTLHGIHMYYPDGLSGCSKISNFLVYKSFDFGIWFHPKCSIEMSDIILVDNTCGVMPMVYGPAALTHITSDKFVSMSDSLIVGTSPSFDCTTDVPDSGNDNIRQSSGNRTPRTPTGGKVGFTFASFSSGTSGAPFFAFHGLMQYTAISGSVQLTDVTFSNFDSNCNGKVDKVFMTNPSNGDAMHPMVVQGLEFYDVDEDSKLFIHAPSLGFVNPADCVDMDCDGKKKAMIKDLDGSMIGSPGTIIPMSEYEWDGDARHGVGDYRIPKMMLTEPDGTRIPVDDIAPNKGIIRNSQCSWNDEWRAHECHGLDHMMMIVESMDADTEVRRVSPVGLLADGYVDLINGPMDHGWCHGYTCQERISTFYTIVAMDKNYEMYFTGTNPQHLRLHILDADDTQALTVGTWYANPQRLDVYRNGIYIAPTNAELSGSTFTWKAKDPNLPDDQFMPPLDSQVSGLNYFDRELQTLYILIRGNEPIDIKTSPCVIVSFDVEPVLVDNFFEENLVTNLAGLLDVEEDQIRVVEVVSESSSSKRKRRAVEASSVTLEIGDPPSPTIDTPEHISSNNNTSNFTTTTPAPSTDSNYTGLNSSLSFSQLQDISSYLVSQGQTGGLNDGLGLNIVSLSVTEAVDTPTDPTGGVRATNETGGPTNGTLYGDQDSGEESDGESVQYQIISNINVYTAPGGTYEEMEFVEQPIIDALDGLGDHVKNVGNKNVPWQVTVSLRAGTGDSRAVLLGNKTATFVSGYANFTDLAITYPGDYILDFNVTQPENLTYWTSSSTFTVENRPYALSVVASPSSATEEEVFATQPLIAIVNNVTGDVAENITRNGHTWQASASLVMASMYLGELRGNTTIPVDVTSTQAEFYDLFIDVAGIDHIIEVTVTSDPDDYELTITLPSFDVTSLDAYVPTGASKTVKLEFDAVYSTVISGMENYFTIMFINQMSAKYTNISISDVELSEGSIVVDFIATGPEIDLDASLVLMYEDVKSGLTLTFNGHTITAMETMQVDGQDYYGNDPQAFTSSSSLAVILGVVFAFLAIVLVCLIVFIWWKKKHSASKDLVSMENIPLDDNNMKHESLSAKLLKDDDNQDQESGIGMGTPEQLREPRLPALQVNGGEFDFTTDDMKEMNITSSRPVSAASTRSGNTPVRSPTVIVESLPPGVNSPSGNIEKEIDVVQHMTVIAMNSDRSFRKFGNSDVSMTGSMEKLRKQLIDEMPKKLKGKPFLFLKESLIEVETVKEKKLVVSEVYGGDCVLVKFLPDTVATRFFCFCGAVAHVECTLCENQTYCSPKCQSADWPTHMTVCLNADNDKLKP